MTAAGAAITALLSWTQAQQAPAAKGAAGEELAVALEAIRAKHGVSALAAARLADGALAECAAVGERRAGSGERVTIDDRFQLGSCGKSMTATLVARLVADGKLRGDSTLGELFPEHAATMDAAWRGVTVRLLLDHLSGLPEQKSTESAATRDVDRTRPPQEQRGAIAAALLAQPLATPPGSACAYSNDGYFLLGAIVERVADAPFEEMLRQRLFVPLGMESAGFGPPGRDALRSQPWGHSFILDFRSSDDPRAPIHAHPAWYAPAGDVHASLPDWAKFAAFHLGTGAPLFTKEQFTALHAPARGATHVCGATITTYHWSKAPVLAQWGMSRGWTSYFALAPTERIGYLVACNQGGNAAAAACTDAVALLVARSPRPR